MTLARLCGRDPPRKEYETEWNLATYHQTTSLTIIMKTRENFSHFSHRFMKSVLELHAENFYANHIALHLEAPHIRDFKLSNCN